MPRKPVDPGLTIDALQTRLRRTRRTLQSLLAGLRIARNDPTVTFAIKQIGTVLNHNEMLGNPREFMGESPAEERTITEAVVADVDLSGLRAACEYRAMFESELADFEDNNMDGGEALVRMDVTSMNKIRVEAAKLIASPALPEYATIIQYALDLSHLLAFGANNEEIAELETKIVRLASDTVYTD
jgi:hypothetical protein